MKASRIFGVVRFELGRESSKKSLWIVIVLMILPLIVAINVKSFSETYIENPRLWANIMGFVSSSSSLNATIAGALSVISWGWLIAILFGGDLFAADLEDGTIGLILSRPVSRLHYIIGKFTSTLIMMIIVFLAGGLSVYAASWIIAGRQEGLIELVLLSTLIAFNAMPLLMVSALLGFKFRKPLVGYVLGFVVYFGGSIVTGIVSAYYMIVHNDMVTGMKLATLIGALIPLINISALSQIAYNAIHPEEGITVFVNVDNTASATTLNFGEYLVPGIVALIGWIIFVLFLAWIIFRKSDL